MNPKHLEKIKKCFDLTKSSNPNEAANALAMARKLMRKYGLSDEDIEFIEMGETTSKSRIQTKPTLYVNFLLGNIADVFQVLPLVVQTDLGAFPEFIGRKEAAMMAAYAFDVLYRQMMNARKLYLLTLNPRMLKKNKTVRADRYCEGWVVSVVGNLKPESLPKEEEAHIRSYIDNRFKGKALDVAKVNRRSGGRDSDFYSGVTDGRNVQVNTPVNGREQHKIQHSVTL
ncbi:hypothetical protein CGT72_10005 [Vibrio cholerae]|uniref:DUF2786 domain-containing protein n=1 Tax=Vibrio cholerae TaxID=666 RepID=UPI000BA96BC9|nr:DUF2786 domain-containing protein [Vibrio cholerae]PAS33390.1 hypothetical protein CGT72_10005 [Vibrio cholerae]